MAEPEQAQDSQNASRGADEPRGEAFSERFSAEFQNAVALGDELIGYLGSVADLLRLELALAWHTLPRLISAWLLLMPLALLVWLSFSVTIAWTAYALSGYVIAGLLGFLMLQMLALGLCWLQLKRYRRRMRLPHTREHLATFRETIRNELGNRR